MRPILILAAVCTASLASAKGLDDLSENNPETAPPAEAAEAGEDGEEAKKPEAPLPPSALSKQLAQNLSITTGFARVIASKSSGDWQGNGMSDLTVAYKLAVLSKEMNLSGTYRYAPVAVSGEEDGHSYRGVWEGHFFGARVGYAVKENLTALGSAELGYVMQTLTPVDSLPGVDKHADPGVAFAIGGGADWSLMEKAALAAGPRVSAAFGSFSMIQIGGALSFLF